MTSQIVLMNGFGVAIASDSAVTLGEARTFDTAEKVIPLPPPHRIAVLHAGDVRIGNLPYSVFVEEWIRQLGSKALRNAEAYQLSFQDWIANNQQWFSPDAEKNEVLRFIENRAEALVGRFRAIERENPDFEFETLLTEWTTEASEAERLEGASVELALHAFARYSEEVDELFESHILPVSDSDSPKEDFLQYCAQFFSSEWMTRSTLTFVGYGEHEIYASYTTISLHGFIDRKLRWIKNDDWALSPEQSPLFGIALPAQRDAIDQYLVGYDSYMVSTLKQRSLDDCYEILYEIRRKFDDDESTLQKLEDAIEEVMENYEEKISDAVSAFSEEHYVRPLRFALAALPAGSMVDVARSLIELQALRKTTTAQQGTVGGPIDVALITPANGFTWVRHKSIG